MTWAWDKEKKLKPKQELKPWPPNYLAGISTELWELIYHGEPSHLTEFICDRSTQCYCKDIRTDEVIASEIFSGI